MDFAHGACRAMVTQKPYIALHKKVKPPPFATQKARGHAFNGLAIAVP